MDWDDLNFSMESVYPSPWAIDLPMATDFMWI